MAEVAAERAELTTTAKDLTRHRPALDALTGIRLFAAVYVVVFHSRVGELMAAHHLQFAANFFQNGYTAVPLFFLLSGFILAYTYRGQIETGAARKRFWEARFARIWPAYAMSLLLMLTALPAIPPASNLISAFFMVQAWNPVDIGFAGVCNGVCWTLSVEALFYLIFPWVQRWVEDRDRRGQMLWLAGSLGLCVVLNTPYRTLWYHAHGVWRHIPLAIVHVPEFLAGVGLGNLFLNRKNGALPGGGAWTYGAAALTLGLLCLPDGRLTGLIVLGYAPLLYGLAAETSTLSRMLATGFMVAGGGISYSIYLMQLAVKAWVQMGCDRVGLVSTGVRLGLNAVVLAIVAYAMFHLVENPARLALRRMFARMDGS